MTEETCDKPVDCAGINGAPAAEIYLGNFDS